jgi:hypothetical protein
MRWAELQSMGMSLQSHQCLAQLLLLLLLLLLALMIMMILSAAGNNAGIWRMLWCLLRLDLCLLESAVDGKVSIAC